MNRGKVEFGFVLAKTIESTAPAEEGPADLSPHRGRAKSFVPCEGSLKQFVPCSPITRLVPLFINKRRPRKAPNSVPPHLELPPLDMAATPSVVDSMEEEEKNIISRYDESRNRCSDPNTCPVGFTGDTDGLGRGSAFEDIEENNGPEEPSGLMSAPVLGLSSTLLMWSRQGRRPKRELEVLKCLERFSLGSAATHS